MELKLYTAYVSEEDGASDDVRSFSDPAAEELSGILFELAEDPQAAMGAVLLDSARGDFIQFYVMGPSAIRAESAEEALCHVEYCRRFPGGQREHFFTEKLTWSEVVGIFELYLGGDESWRERKEWRKLARSGPESRGDFASKLGSLAIAALFFLGCWATPMIVGRVMFFIFGAVFVYNAFRFLGYKTGKPWEGTDDLGWPCYDEEMVRKADRKKWKPPSGKEFGAFVAEYKGLLIFLAISGFFVVYGIQSGSCRNGFNRKDREPPAVERDSGAEPGPKAPGKSGSQGGGKPR